MHEDAGDAGHKDAWTSPRAAQTHPIIPCRGQSDSRHTETASAHLLCCLLRNTLHSEVPARSGDLIKICLFKARKVNFLFPVCFVISYIAFSLSYSSVKTHAVGRLRSLFYGIISRGCPAFLLFQQWLSVDFHIICSSFPKHLTSIDEMGSPTRSQFQMVLHSSLTVHFHHVVKFLIRQCPGWIPSELNLYL